MEMLISPNWLQRKIESDPDIDTDAGPSMAVQEALTTSTREYAVGGVSVTKR